MDEEIHKKVTSLPILLQVALWVILNINNAENKDFSFYSSDFASRFKPYIKKHLSIAPDEYGKFVGATLSGLLRNGILVKLTGDRDKLWTLSDDIKINFKNLKDKLFEIKVYWN